MRAYLCQQNPELLLAIGFMAGLLVMFVWCSLFLLEDAMFERLKKRLNSHDR